jgi:hypothetical protein
MDSDVFAVYFIFLLCQINLFVHFQKVMLSTVVLRMLMAFTLSSAFLRNFVFGQLPYPGQSAYLPEANNYVYSQVNKFF